MEANADGLIGPTHSFAGLASGNLASAASEGAASSPRAAALQGLAKMRRLADLGLPQFVLPPQERPDVGFLRLLGFGGSDAAVLEAAWRAAPLLARAATSASSMWAANAATVTAAPDSGDGRLHLTVANLHSNLHRSLEPEQTARALRRLLPDPALFAVHDALPPHPALADEGAANQVRLSGQGGQGVDLLVWGREADARWDGRHPARQRRAATEAITRRHGVRRPVLARQGHAAIEAGAFHNDVVCVGAGATLLFHAAAFEDTDAMRAGVRAAAATLFDPVLLEISEAELPLADAVSSYLFNSQLLQLPGHDRLLLLAPTETRDTPRARAVAERLAASNGPIGEVDYVDVRESMGNGGGPACLRLRLPLTERQLAAANPAQRLNTALNSRLTNWVVRSHRDRLHVSDLRDPALLIEGRTALDELTRILDLGSDFYPFQRA